MKRNLLLFLVNILLFSISSFAQGEVKSEEDLKEKANELFVKNEFKEAKPIYAQLLSLYPQDPNYNYRYGACLLETDADKTEPLKYLSFSISKGGVDPLAYYYLARAHHLNYEFAKAVKFYSRFKTKASPEEREKYKVERKIEMCKNGNQLLSKLNDVQVIERQVIAEKDFYRIYDTESVNGKLISKPVDFQSKYDKKVGEKSIIFLPNNAREAYFSSYGKKGENGKDLYKAIKLGDGSWSEPVSLGASINTKYDEDYAFIHPDGRTLYFASKGHTSMGGYDLFKSTFDDATGQWIEPENLDFAFSSADDDIMFITDQAGVVAYFASNRSNEIGKYTVYKVLVDRKPAQLSVIAGKFISESNPENKKAKITVIEKSSNETVGIYETDEQGNYKIEIAENGGDYQFNIETTDDAPIHTGVVSIPEQPEFEILGQELRLVGTGEEQTLVIKNIFDGTVAQSTSSSGPLVSSEILRMKANLDVNYQLNNLDELAATGLNNEKETDATSPIESGNEVDSNRDNSSNQGNSGSEGENGSGNIDEISTGTSENSASVLNQRLDELLAKSNKQLEEKQSAINVQYSKALQQKKRADELFVEANALENNGASSVEIEIKKKEAGIEALKAAYSTQIAQEIERSTSQDLENIEKIENSSTSVQAKIDGADLAEAELEINNLEQTQQNYQAASDIIDTKIKELEESDQLATKQISDYNSKKESFTQEKEELNTMISNLEKDLESASGGEKEDIQKNIDALNLDQADLEYQENRMKDNMKKAMLSKKSLQVERDELIAARNRISSTSSSSSSSNSISEEEINSLVAQLKEYRDNDVLAYSPTNELYSTEIQTGGLPITDDETDGSARTTGTSDTDIRNEDPSLSTITSNETNDVPSYGNKQVVEINNEFENTLSQSETISDRDLQISNQLVVYDNWVAALEEKRNVLSEQYDAEIDESIRRGLKQELDEIDLLIKEKKERKRELEEELKQQSSATAQTEVTPIDNVSDITAQTIVDDSFTNFDYNQSLTPTSTFSNTKYTEAKRALYEAGEISKQARLAEESAYSLPTAEERAEAFRKVNQLTKASEQKQLVAAAAFAEFNLMEFQDNRARINNANNFGEEVNSGSLDLAILLSEEAEVYFENAAQIRAEINDSDRLSKKEVELQKAYDYEVLALEKQKEAMSKLSLVVDEVVSNSIQAQASEANDSTSARKSFVQVISDSEVLAITNATEAKTKADAKKEESLNLQAALDKEMAIADSLPQGTEKDSVIAITETLKEEIDQIRAEAAILYERESQIKAGITSVDGAPNPKAQVLAVRKAAIVTDQIAIDTVVVNDERKDVILNSQSYKDFSKNREELAAQLKEIETIYNQAVQIAEENQQLRKDAVIEKNKVNLVEDEAEKERLIKSAQVIEQKIASNDRKIDSINKVIKVKNFVVITLEKKDNQLLSGLSEIEKSEYQSLAKEIIPSDLVTAAPISRPRSAADELVTNQLNSSESSQSTESLDLIPTESANILTEDVVDNTRPIDTSEPEESNTEENPSTETESKTELSSTTEQPSTTTETAKDISVDIGSIDIVPRQIKEAIFITLNKDESAYDERKPIPTKRILPEGIVYKVQVGAFRNPIPQDLFKGFAPLMSEKTESGITRYTAGLFVSEKTAIEARNNIRQIGYPDAFVVAFLNGERISISQARNQAQGESPTSNTNRSDQSGGTSSNNNFDSPSGSSTNNLSPAFEKNDVQEVIDAKSVEGLYFTVQIGVYSAPVKKGTFSYESINVIELPNGLIRYNAGIFRSVLDAAELKNNIQSSIKDAFISAYYNGKRVSLTEASKLKSR